MASIKLPLHAMIAKEAGDAALAMQAEIVEKKLWEKKSDGSIVTPADKRAHEIIKARYKEHMPGLPFLSEEGDPLEFFDLIRKDGELIITDPLDNTQSFAGGHNGWSVNIGRVKNGVPVEGVAYFPGKKELFFTGNDGKAYLQKGDAPPFEIHVQGLPLRQPLQVATGYKESILTHLEHRNVPHHAVQLAGQYRTCMVANGTCDVTGINTAGGTGYNCWDTAGPHAVLRAAGGEMVNARTGMPIRYRHQIRLEDYIAGGRDTLIALGLTTRKDLEWGIGREKS